MQLKKTTLSKIRSNSRLKDALIDYFNITPRTYYRWLSENNRCFTEFESLQLISSYTGIEDHNDLIEPTP
jgi:uncharacterized protein YutE (UPF0331/DUF86 family)